MDFIEKISNTDLILAEAAVIESLRRSGAAALHPRLENALLIYDDVGGLVGCKNDCYKPRASRYWAAAAEPARLI